MGEGAAVGAGVEVRVAVGKSAAPVVAVGSGVCVAVGGICVVVGSTSVTIGGRGTTVPVGVITPDGTVGVGETTAGAGVCVAAGSGVYVVAREGVGDGTCVLRTAVAVTGVSVPSLAGDTLVSVAGW